VASAAFGIGYRLKRRLIELAAASIEARQNGGGSG